MSLVHESIISSFQCILRVLGRGSWLKHVFHPDLDLSLTYSRFLIPPDCSDYSDCSVVIVVIYDLWKNMQSMLGHSRSDTLHWVAVVT